MKAFNTVLGRRLAEPVVDGMRLDGFYAGDDARAKAAVAELLAAMGFRPLDFGPLRGGPIARAPRVPQRQPQRPSRLVLVVSERAFHRPPYAPH